MRAYLSFVLVLFSLMLLFSILQFGSYSDGRAVLNERAYLISMNSKEATLESLRQGALKGFDLYDSTHRLENCIHCPPCHPELCEPLKCQKCFRESEAMESAKQSALLRLNLLRFHTFDGDFSISIGSVNIQTFSRGEIASRNGFALDSIRVNNDIKIGVSSDKFGLDGSVKIPEGLIIYASHN